MTGINKVTSLKDSKPIILDEEIEDIGILYRGITQNQTKTKNS